MNIRIMFRAFMARGRCWSGVEAHLAWSSTAITRHAPWQPSDEHARLNVDPLMHPAVRQDIVNDLVGFEVEPDQPLMEAGLDSIGAPDTSAEAGICSTVYGYI